ncbi:MAG TPA: hypothetical protein VGG70_11315 [Candidatus Cybelea sp.]|jgi:hypothetical protein
MLAACGQGGASEPPVTSFDPSATSKLQVAVGVATMAFNGGASVAYGLNTVETLRQKDGLSGTLYNVPMIIGPTSFDVLYSTETGSEVQSAGSDLGTNHITWGTLNQTLWTGPPRGPKGSTTGAFGYGLCPCNSDSGPGNGFTPLFQAYALPIYGGQSDVQRWYGGPPAFPAAGPSLVALGWEGYSLGFTDFAVAPVLGTYHMYAAVPPAYDTPQNPTPSPNPNGSPTPPPGILAAGAQLTSLAPLPAFATPAFKPDNKGGGTIALTVPKGATEVMAVVRALGGSGTTGTCVTAHSSDAFYTVVTTKSGKQSLFLPDELGPLTQSGQPTQTICAKGSYDVYAAAADYPAYEASYPNNLAQLPAIRGKNGQADISTSDALSATYP